MKIGALQLDYDSCKQHLMTTNIDAEYLKFECPSRIVIYGGSSTGKTTLICQILSRHRKLFEKPIDNLLYLNAMLETDAPFAPKETVQTLLKTFPDMVIGHEMPPAKDAGLTDWIAEENEKGNKHLAFFIDDFQSSLHLMEQALTADCLCHVTKSLSWFGCC